MLCYTFFLYILQDIMMTQGEGLCWIDFVYAEPVTLYSLNEAFW